MSLSQLEGRPCPHSRISTQQSHLCFLSLSTRSSDSEEAFETPESTTPVKAPPAPPPPPPEVTPEPEVIEPPAPEEPGNQMSGATGSRGQSWLLDSAQWLAPSLLVLFYTSLMSMTDRWVVLCVLSGISFVA